MLLRPAWQLPPGVGAAMSTRAGGVSRGPYAALNLGMAVGDDPSAVAENRARFASALGARPVWLRQVHGIAVLELQDAADSDTAADAAWTCQRGIACTVQAADCLPVLLAVTDGRAVAAAHAGWRGLAAGVLQAAVAALCRGSGAAPAELQAWLGPCIGPRRFEVGDDVPAAFPGAEQHFAARTRADGSPGWLADLSQLARANLTAAGVGDITSAAACTVEDPSRFFSFRRDGVTGRMAAAIWRLN